MELAVITGGARGIGAATVAAFRQAGYDVAFLYEKNHEAAEKTAACTGARAIACDVSDEAAVRAAFSQLGTVSVLINNAAVSHVGLISQISTAQWDRLFAVNVRGIYNCVNAVLPAMLARQGGCILNVASMWGQVGASCEVCYSATKGAVIALTKALAQELAPSHIRVNAVSPGVIATDMNAHLNAQELQALAAQTPLETLGAPGDVAQALVYLAGAGFVTGQILAVNGGFVL